MDLLSAFRGMLVAYVAGLAVLGVVTLGWALTEALLLDNATLATWWFAVAGAGAVLTAGLIVWYYRLRARETALEAPQAPDVPDRT